LRGKDYVLLDFWASWCVPCREMTPALKAAYQKFHAKGLAIVSISWDLNEKAWLNAISKDSINDWYNIYDDISHNTENNLGNRYAIASIPTLILINRNGIIIDRYGGSEEKNEEDLFSKLSEIFVNEQ